MTFEEYLKQKFNLSRAQFRVLELVRAGLDNRACAATLHRTEQTIKYHLTAIYKRMSIRPRAKLIAKLNFEHLIWEAEEANRPPAPPPPPPPPPPPDPNLLPFSKGGG